jgi:hypothetical protein
MFVPDPVFYPSRIPVPTTATKEEGEKICCPTFFCSHKYQKMKNYFIYEQGLRKELEPIHNELLYL